MVLDHRFPRIGIGSSSGGEVRGHDDDAGDDEEDGSIEDKELKTKIRRWRMATRLVQMATDGGIHGLLEDTPLLLHHNNSTNNHQNNSSQDVGNRWKSFVSSLRREYYALCPPDSIFNLPDHSCLPNCLVEGTTITVTAAIQDGNNNDEDGTGPIHLSLIATHDIRQNDVLHISKIDDLTGDINERGMLLEEIYGRGYVCGCVRCRIERNWCRREFIIKDDDTVATVDSALNDNDDGDGKGLEDVVFHRRDIRHLADLAMQHGRYEDASDLYGMLLLQQLKQKKRCRW